MKKLLGILLLILFAISMYFSISNEISTASMANETPGYASIIPIPPPPPPGRRGC